MNEKLSYLEYAEMIKAMSIWFQTVSKELRLHTDKKWEIASIISEKLSIPLPTNKKAETQDCKKEKVKTSTN